MAGQAIRGEIARRAAERDRARQAQEEDLELAKENEQTNWAKIGRPDQQIPPGEWLTWLILAGRGWGKTKTGAEAIRALVCGPTPLTAGRYSRIAIIAETAADARDVMIDGPSGILAVHPSAYRPTYLSSKRRITWPNGARASIFNATEPDQLRGPQFDLAWGDELAKWAYADDTYDQLQFGLRLVGTFGDQPRQIFTTTPRPIPIVRQLLESPDTFITRGDTLDNRANLAPKFLKKIVDRYEGTRLGRQELNAEVLDDVQGALWTRAMIDVAQKPIVIPQMVRIVVAIDPSGARGADDEDADSIGIVVAGKGVDGRGYVLEDGTCKLSPAGWGRRAVDLYYKHKADRIIAERNFGGAMVESTIRVVDQNVSFREVTASKNKVVRAEPVAALYEQGKISHVARFNALEDQMCQMTGDGYLGDGSPDRVDALCWSLSELMVTAGTGGFIEFYKRQNDADAAKKSGIKPAALPAAPTTPQIAGTAEAPVQPKGTIAMRGNAWNEASGMAGRTYRAGADGIIFVDPEDVSPFIGAGYVRV